MQFNTEDEGIESEQVEEDLALTNQLKNLRAAEAALLEAQGDYEAERTVLVQLLRERGLKSTYVSCGDKVYKTTVVAGSRMKVDQEALKKRLGVRTFNKMTVRAFNPAMFTAMVEKNEIDVEKVADLITYVPNKVFPKITPVESVEL